MKKIIIIAGPTCSGKSSIGLKIAKELNGVVISADSMQIYKHMDIGTAKTMENEMEGIEHLMLDVVAPDKEFSVSDYRDMTNELIEKTDKTPIIVGGTGLYINSLIFPMQMGGVEKDEKLRAELKSILEEKGADYLHSILKDLDAETAEKIHPNNTKRVIRAIEIAKTGDKLKSQQNDKIMPYRDYILIGLDIPRQQLYNRINERVEIMFNSGLKDELDGLIKDKHLDFDMQSMKAIGYKEFKEFYEDKWTLDEVKDKIKQHTRNYAKRQMTWFRRYENIKWFNPLTDENKILEYIKREYGIQ